MKIHKSQINSAFLTARINLSIFFLFFLANNIFLQMTEKYQVPVPPCYRSIKFLRSGGVVRRLEIWWTRGLPYLDEVEKNIRRNLDFYQATNLYAQPNTNTPTEN